MHEIKRKKMLFGKLLAISIVGLFTIGLVRAQEAEVLGSTVKNENITGKNLTKFAKFSLSPKRKI